MPRPAVTFFFSSCGCAEELAEAPEAIENLVVLWHMARCTGVEDFVATAGDFLAIEGIGTTLEEVA